MFRTIVRSLVLVGVLAVPSVAMAQSYVPTTPDTPVVLTPKPLPDPAPTTIVAPTTVAPAVAPAVAVAPAAVVQPSENKAPVNVKGVQISGDTPAFTGSNQTKPLLATSLVLLAGGAVLVAANRRRRILTAG